MPEVWYLKKVRELEKANKELQEKLNKKEKKLKNAEGEIVDLKRQLQEMAKAKEAKRPRFPDYSLSKHEKNTGLKEHKKSTGRVPFAEKLKDVEFEENVYPDNVEETDCVLVSKKIVTRINDGRKEIWLYHIYRKKWSFERGKLPEVFGKSEYGMEVVSSIAFLVYSLGIPHAATSQIMEFFCGIKIGKSEINSLLNQLSKSWEKEFEKISDLIVLSMFVHIDETGWRIGKKNCYTWIFKSLMHTILLYGEKRDESVLDRILPWQIFLGTGITDCYKMYEKRFTAAQKCWAHFLRKALKLKLMYPEKKEYHAFFEKLYDIFIEAKDLKKGKKKKLEGIEKLEKAIKNLCIESETKLSKKTEKDQRELVNLQKNLTRNIKDLFTFVLNEGVDPTNNTAEQGLRHVARARNNYQTSKTEKGAKRHSIIASVIFSLKQNLPEFTMKSITKEIISWNLKGQSLFDQQLKQAQAISA